VPALAFLFGTRSAVVLVVVPLLVTNIFILARAPVERDVLRRLVPLIACYIPSVVLGAFVLRIASISLLTIVVGALVVLSGGVSLASPRFVVPARGEVFASMGTGFVAGAFNGAASLAGPVLALYLSGLRLEKWAFVWAITVMFTVGNSTQLVLYTQLNLLSGNVLVFSIAMLPLTWLGQRVGLHIHDRLDPAAFRRLVLVVVILSGVSLVLKGVQGG
jgi:uncharacterized membrane protein YfcA